MIQPRVDRVASRSRRIAGRAVTTMTRPRLTMKKATDGSTTAQTEATLDRVDRQSPNCSSTNAVRHRQGDREAETGVQFVSQNALLNSRITVHDPGGILQAQVEDPGAGDAAAIGDWTDDRHQASLLHGGVAHRVGADDGLNLGRPFWTRHFVPRPSLQD